MNTGVRTLLGFQTMYFLYVRITYLFIFERSMYHQQAIFSLWWKRIYTGNAISLLKCHEKGDKDQASLEKSGKKKSLIISKAEQCMELTLFVVSLASRGNTDNNDRNGEIGMMVCFSGLIGVFLRFLHYWVFQYPSLSFYTGMSNTYF